ncbi:hypothetical protein BH11PSE11_BH11PSE11_30170 [soil metagenome]
MRPKRPFMRPSQDRFLDGMMTFIIISLMIGLAFGEAGMLFRKATTINVLHAFSGASFDLSEHFAVHGTWPDQMIVKESRSEKAGDVNAVAGAMTIHVPAGYGQQAAKLTMRPATVPEAGSPVVMWICGSHAAPHGMRPSGLDATTLTNGELYAMCR